MEPQSCSLAELCVKISIVRLLRERGTRLDCELDLGSDSLISWEHGLSLYREKKINVQLFSFRETLRETHDQSVFRTFFVSFSGFKTSDDIKGLASSSSFEANAKSFKFKFHRLAWPMTEQFSNSFQF